MREYARASWQFDFQSTICSFLKNFWILNPLYAYSWYKYFFIQITWDAWTGIARVGTVAVEKKVFDIAKLSRLYEGSGVCAVYMAERLTHQLGNGEDLVSVAPLQFTLFPYEAPNKIVNLWTSGVCYLEQLVEDGDFEEYQ